MAASTSLTRALLAFLALPGIVAFAVPLLANLLRRPDDAIPLADSFNRLGLIPLLAGTALLLWCARDFYVAGRGTMAPWDPPRHLVVRGPYRLSRNPMYIAVGLILFGWAIGFGSAWLLLYTAAVMTAMHVRVVTGEEPHLARAHRGDWERYRARVPRWIFRRRKAVVLAVAAVAIALPLAGLIYEAYAESVIDREFPPPGMLVDIGGRSLHLYCIGDGSPTVLFEANGWGVTSLGSAAVRERVASRTRVCSYDPAGMGWSDPAAEPMTAGAMARDLAVLQDKARLAAPFVIVASSIGGLTAEMFARQYPERVAGLVFLDAASSGNLADLEPYFRSARISAPVLTAAARLGLIRLLDPFRIDTGSDEGRRSAAITYSGNAIAAIASIARAAPETQREFAAAPPLPSGMPLVVLSASDPNAGMPARLAGGAAALREQRVQIHQALAKRSTRGSWQTVPNSEHLIASSQPDAVIDVIFAMLDELP